MIHEKRIFLVFEYHEFLLLLMQLPIENEEEVMQYLHQAYNIAKEGKLAAVISVREHLSFTKLLFKLSLMLHNMIIHHFFTDTGP